MFFSFYILYLSPDTHTTKAFSTVVTFEFACKILLCYFIEFMLYYWYFFLIIHWENFMLTLVYLNANFQIFMHREFVDEEEEEKSIGFFSRYSPNKCCLNGSTPSHTPILSLHNFHMQFTCLFLILVSFSTVLITATKRQQNNNMDYNYIPKTVLVAIKVQNDKCICSVYNICMP